MTVPAAKKHQKTKQLASRTISTKVRFKSHRAEAKPAKTMMNLMKKWDAEDKKNPPSAEFIKKYDQMLKELTNPGEW